MASNHSKRLTPRRYEKTIRMKNIITIAKNTFKEAIRDKIIYGILAFAILFIASTVLFGSLSLGEDIKIIRDFGLAGIYLFSVIIAIFMGTSLIYKEIEKKTIYILLSKPVSSTEIILGKFIGLIAALKLVIILMAGVYLTVVGLKGGGFDWRGLVAIVMIIPEIAIFISLSILFSTFSTPFAATIYSVLILVIGHSLNFMLLSVKKSAPAFKYFIETAYYLLPNLEKFNLRNIVVQNSSLNLKEIILSLIYGIIYASIILFLANLSLKKQEF